VTFAQSFAPVSLYRLGGPARKDRRFARQEVVTPGRQALQTAHRSQARSAHPRSRLGPLPRVKPGNPPVVRGLPAGHAKSADL